MAAVVAQGATPKVPLVEDGTACAEIILVEGSLPAEDFAAMELIEHVRLVSGAQLKILHKPSGVMKTVIRLGRAAKTDLAGCKNNWAKIVVADGTIDIAGVDGTGPVPRSDRTACGTLFGVYEFLERELGVRWIWPGELGTFYRPLKSVSARVGAREIRPFAFTRWRHYGDRNRPGWANVANADRYYENERLWLRRHKFVSADSLSLGHAFTEAWQTQGKGPPGYFHLLPDDTRRPDPFEGGGRPDLVTLCTSNPKTVDMVVDAWKAAGGREPINANENDSRGKCCCPNCLRANGCDDPVGTLKRAKAAFDSKDPGWAKELGSQSLRYARFYRSVLDAGRKVDPDCRVIAAVYANYSDPPPPGSVKLDPAIILRFCPPLMYPWTPEKVAYYKRVWSGWSDTGASIMSDPIFTLDGHNFPLLYYRPCVDCLDFERKHGVMSVDMDSLLGIYGANGLTHYAIAQKISHPEATVKELEDDYYAAFGSSEPVMRRVFERFREASERGFEVTEADKNQIEGGCFADFLLRSHRVFPQEMMRTALEELSAAIRAERDPLVVRRLDFVRIGLTDAAMVQKTQREFTKYTGFKKETVSGRHFESPGVSSIASEADSKAAFVKACRSLVRFRKDHEALGYVNPTPLAYYESRLWPRYYGETGPEAVELGDWELKLDPDKDGPADWTKIGKVRNAPGGYDKVCWYRCRFSVEDPAKFRRVVFGGILGQPVVYVNGKMLLDRHPVLTRSLAWCATVSVATDFRKGENELLVRMDREIPGQRGLFAPVFVDREL